MDTPVEDMLKGDRNFFMGVLISKGNKHVYVKTYKFILFI